MTHLISLEPNGTSCDLLQWISKSTHVHLAQNAGQSSSPNVDDLLKQIEEFTKDITTRVKQNSVVAEGMQTFFRRYKTLTESGLYHNARLSSALHRFG